MSVEYVQHRIGNTRHIEVHYYPRTVVLHTEPAQTLALALPKIINQLTYNKTDCEPVFNALDKLNELMTEAIKTHTKRADCDVELEYLHPPPQQVTVYFLDEASARFANIAVLFDKIIRTHHAQFYIENLIQPIDGIDSIDTIEERFIELELMEYSNSDISAFPFNDVPFKLRTYSIKKRDKFRSCFHDTDFATVRRREREKLLYEISDLLTNTNNNIQKWNSAITKYLHQIVLNLKTAERYGRCPPIKPAVRKNIQTTSVITTKRGEECREYYDDPQEGLPGKNNAPKGLYELMPRLVKYWYWY